MILSGQITVTTAGTAVVGPSVGGEFVFKAHPDNAGNVYLGNDGEDDVAGTTGIVLAPGDLMIIRLLRIGGQGGLSDMYFDAATNGDKVCWLRFDAVTGE